MSARYTDPSFFDMPKKALCTFKDHIVATPFSCITYQTRPMLLCEYLRTAWASILIETKERIWYKVLILKMFNLTISQIDTSSHHLCCSIWYSYLDLMLTDVLVAASSLVLITNFVSETLMVSLLPTNLVIFSQSDIAALKFNRY